MRPISFSKPAPATPFPLNEWLDRTDRAEVGREPFFRGRDLEYEVFQRAVNSFASGHIGGGTMIFQGAPGAGKTAFKNECIEAVCQHSTPQEPWVPVPVKPSALNSAPSVIKAMMEATKRELDRLVGAFPDYESSRVKNLKEALLTGLKKLDVTVNVGVVGFTRHGESESAQSQLGLSADMIFSDAATYFENIRLVIFVDEAQNTPVSESTKAVLSCLHEGVQGISLLAAFFGLSDTEEVLRQCGLSRPARDRVITLETMSQEEAASAIQGVFDAYEFSGPDQSTWVDELASLSQGWPQHINSVAVAAGQVIQKNGGSLQSNLLQQAVELGKEKKEQYYYTRLKACSGEPWVYKQLAEAAADSGGVLARSEIDKLTETFRSKDQSIYDFLADALHAGVLMELRKLPKHYKIPIPSFSDYLRELSL